MRTSPSTCSMTRAVATPEKPDIAMSVLSRVVNRDAEKGPNPFEGLMLQSFGSDSGRPTPV